MKNEFRVVKVGWLEEVYFDRFILKHITLHKIKVVARFLKVEYYFLFCYNKYRLFNGR